MQVTRSLGDFFSPQTIPIPSVKKLTLEPSTAFSEEHFAFQAEKIWERKVMEKLKEKEKENEREEIKTAEKEKEKETEKENNFENKNSESNDLKGNNDNISNKTSNNSNIRKEFVVPPPLWIVMASDGVLFPF